MKISERDIRIWSSIGTRATFGIAALELAKKHKDLIVVTSDVSTSAGLDRFRKTLPNQYIDVGIAEQNMMGIAAGLASENFQVITTTFTPFQTARCCEQIKVNLNNAGGKEQAAIGQLIAAMEGKTICVQSSTIHQNFMTLNEEKEVTILL